MGIAFIVVGIVIFLSTIFIDIEDPEILIAIGLIFVAGGAALFA